MDISFEDLDLEEQDLQETIYNYFKENNIDQNCKFKFIFLLYGVKMRLTQLNILFIEN